MYRVGDKVKIRKDLEHGERYFMNDGIKGDRMMGDMMGYRGKTTTVVELVGNDFNDNIEYQLEIDNGDWHWVDGMLETIGD